MTQERETKSGAAMAEGVGLYILGALVVVGIYLAAPSTAILFALSVMAGAAAAAIILAITCSIGYCESMVSRMRKKNEVQPPVKIQASRPISA